MLFFGEDILFEGHKTGIEAGYGWTMVYTDRDYLKTRLTIFDMLFVSARRHTLRRYAVKGETVGGQEDDLRQAIINAVVMARDGKTPRRWLGSRRPPTETLDYDCEPQTERDQV